MGPHGKARGAEHAAYVGNDSVVVAVSVRSQVDTVAETDGLLYR